MKFIHKEHRPCESSKSPHRWNCPSFSNDLLNVETWCNNFLVPKIWVSDKVPNWFQGVFNFTTLVGRFLMTFKSSNYTCLVMSSNSPCSPLWKVAMSFWSIFVSTSSIRRPYKSALCHLFLLFFPHGHGDNGHCLSTNKFFTQQKLIQNKIGKKMFLQITKSITN